MDVDGIVDVDTAVDGVVDGVVSGSRRLFMTVWPVGRRSVWDWIASWGAWLWLWSWELEGGDGSSP